MVRHTNSEVVSKEEQEARLAEARRATAEGEYVIILKDKKRILEEIEDSKSILKGTQDAIDKNNEAILVTEKNKLEAIKNSNDENAKLLKTIDETKASLEKLEKLFKDKAAEIKEIDSKIQSLNTAHEVNKSGKLQELAVVDETIKERKDSFDILTVDLFNLIKEIKDKTTELEALDASANDKKANIVNLESSLLSLKGDIDSQEIEKQVNKKAVTQLKDKIKDLEANIVSLDEKIVEKSAVYKELEGKAFNILNKEEILTEREEFLRMQYERAGIDWDPIK